MAFLANTFNAQRKYEDTEVICREIVNSSSHVIADRPPQRASCFVLLVYAEVLEGQEKRVEAEVQYPSRVELGANLSSISSSGILARYKADHALVLRDLGNNEEAELLLRQIKEQYVKFVGIEHEMTLERSIDLAIIIRDHGKYVEAES